MTGEAHWVNKERRLVEGYRFRVQRHRREPVCVEKPNEEGYGDGADNGRWQQRKVSSSLGAAGLR